MCVSLPTMLPSDVSNQFWLRGRNVSARDWVLACSNFTLVILLQTSSSQASLVLPSPPTRGQGPEGPSVASYPLELLLWCLSWEAWQWQSCHVGLSAVTAKVTIDDQNWGCLETQLLCRVLWSTQTQWSRLARVSLKGPGQWGAFKLSLPIPAGFDAHCLTRVSLRSRKGGDRASHAVPCFLALLEKSPSGGLAWWNSHLRNAKVGSEKIFSSNHLLINLADITDQWQRQQSKVITYTATEWMD